MEPYTPGTKVLEDGVLYTARFRLPTEEELGVSPVVSEAEEQKLHEQAQTIMREAMERYTYKPCPEAKAGQSKFIRLSIAFSKLYEVSMEVKRREREISVQMDVPIGPYFGAMKNELDALLHMASAYSIELNDDEHVTFAIKYALYDRYDTKTGEKVDW